MILVLTALGAGDGLKAAAETDAGSVKEVATATVTTTDVSTDVVTKKKRMVADVMKAGNPTYVVPVSGVVTRSLVDTWGALRSEGRSHEGIDIFAKRNTPVVAAVGGRIVRIGLSERGGKIVWVQGEDGYRHYYAHLEDFSDHQRGDRVRRGETIGYVGNSGNAVTTPPHLHYGVYAHDGAINPYPLLTGRDS